MISSLNGQLIFSDINTAVIECGGVGYKCIISLNTQQDLPSINSKAMLFTYMNVREDSIDLFGFSKTEELEMFKLLISVNGVGPKVAIGILSEFQPDKLSIAIAAGDSKLLTRAPGIGPKLAQRIILELKDKIQAYDDSSTDSIVNTLNDKGNISQAIAALISLGYSQSEAATAVSGIDESLDVEQIIKLALKKLF